MNTKKVLYVDDEKINLLLFTKLMPESFDILTANSGKEALKILEEENGDFDYIVSDVRMPGMDGFEFLEKAREKFPTLPRFILTAYSENEQLISSMNTGLIMKWFQKPLNPQAIADAVK